MIIHKQTNRSTQSLVWVIGCSGFRLSGAYCEACGSSQLLTVYISIVSGQLAQSERVKLTSPSRNSAMMLRILCVVWSFLSPSSSRLPSSPAEELGGVPSPPFGRVVCQSVWVMVMKIYLERQVSHWWQAANYSVHVASTFRVTTTPEQKGGRHAYVPRNLEIAQVYCTISRSHNHGAQSQVLRMRNAISRLCKFSDCEEQEDMCTRSYRCI